MIPIYELVISEENHGVELVSFVESPAMRSNWVAFSDSKRHTFQIQSEEKRIVTGAILLADFPVIRMDDKGNPFYVLLRKETIEKTAQDFFKKGYHVGTNKNHNQKDYTDKVYMYESFIVDSSRGIMPPAFLADVAKDGSWIGSYKVDDDDVWNDVKEGKFHGFSIEGFYNMQPVQFSEEKTKEQELLSSLSSLYDVLKKQMEQPK